MSRVEATSTEVAAHSPSPLGSFVCARPRSDIAPTPELQSTGSPGNNAMVLLARPTRALTLATAMEIAACGRLLGVPAPGALLCTAVAEAKDHLLEVHEHDGLREVSVECIEQLGRWRKVLERHYDDPDGATA